MISTPVRVSNTIPIDMGHGGIHYIMWSAGPGGAELSVKHYLKYLSEYQMSVFSLRPEENMIFNEDEIKITTGSFDNVTCYKEYYRYCRKHKSDFFHILNGGPIILLLTLLAGVKNPLYHIHGTLYWNTSWKKLIFKSIWQITRLFRTTFVGVSEYNTAIFHNDVIPVSPRIISNGLETRQFLAKRHRRKSLQKIGYAGRLAEGKNINLVIDLFDELADKDLALELHIAGSGPAEVSIKEFAAAARNADRIHFHGHIDDVAGFYASIDLFLFLSAYESFGNVIAEAILTGLPVLTSDVPVFNEIHEEASNFCLGDPTSFENIRLKLHSKLQNFEELADKAFEQSEVVKSRFDIEQHIKAIKEIYENH